MSRRRKSLSKYQKQLQRNKKMGKGCKAIVAVFSFGPQFCGVRAEFTVKQIDTGDDMPVCEAHYDDYQRLENKL